VNATEQIIGLQRLVPTPIRKAHKQEAPPGRYVRVVKSVSDAPLDERLTHEHKAVRSAVCPIASDDQVTPQLRVVERLAHALCFARFQAESGRARDTSFAG
jgi:hypothetical protein